MYTTLSNRYLIAADFRTRAADFSFPAEVWGVASALSEVGGATSTSALESLTGLGSDQVREAVQRLLAEKLVREDVMSWKDFTTSKKPDSGAVKVAAVVAKPAVNAVQSKAEVPAESYGRNGNASSSNGVAMRLGSITPARSAVSSGSAWIAQKPDTSRVASFQTATPPSDRDQANGRLLRPMLEQIERMKGGGVEGQLLVYQVFLRVPYDLLSAEGIKSLHFVDDQTRIKNPTLIAAIIKAAKDIIGIELV